MPFFKAFYIFGLRKFSLGFYIRYLGLFLPGRQCNTEDNGISVTHTSETRLNKVGLFFFNLNYSKIYFP